MSAGSTSRLVAVDASVAAKLYLALADQLGIDLVVADERLLRSPAGELPFVHPLARFQLTDHA